MYTVHHVLSGQPFDGSAHGEGAITNPATGAVIGTVPFADAATVDAVVERAAAAAEIWGATSLSKRTEVLFAFRHLLLQRAEELVDVISTEHGKVRSDAHGELARGLENVEYACGLVEHLKGSFSAEVASGVDVHSSSRPLGVVVGITPFNFPAMVPLWMAANAIAAGNAFVLKPSEKDPSAAVILASIWREAGLPDGVFSVVHGDAATVQHLLAHDDVAAVSFVGSTPIAKSIYETGTKAGKRVQALGGAKNHMVVLPDADLDLAADAAVSAAYGSTGERCMAISVVVAVDPVGDALVEKLASRTAALVTGPASDPATQMGPLISAVHRTSVLGHVDAAVAAGATAVVDGRSILVPGHEEGFFVGPCLLDHVTTEMSAYDAEVFGPVLVVVRVPTFDAALTLINANPYGNGTAIFTRDGGAARAFNDRVEVGMVGINVPIPVPVSSYSFGGWKDSLFGSHHIYGPEGFAFYTRTKVTTTRWPDPATSSVDLGFPRTR